MHTTTNKRTRKEWISLIEEMKASGQAQTEWCKSRDINYKTMRAMKDKIENEHKRIRAPKKVSGSTTANIPQFVQLPKAQAQGTYHSESGPAITITVKDGIIEVGIRP